MGGGDNKDYIRGGNRGGRDQFNWNDVRLMTYKDRECYLGISEKLGVLDKGGKWKNNKWWVQDKGENGIDAYDLMLEKKIVKAQEDAVMRKNLGMPPQPGDKEILEAKEKGQKLEDYEIKELLRRSQGLPEEIDEIREADKMGGVGFSKFGTSIHNDLQKFAETRLEGVGIEDYKRMMKKLKKDKKEKKKDKKKEKKSKKDKKSKKSKKSSKKRKHTESSGDSDSGSESSNERKRDKKAKRKAGNDKK
jgi:hypothetical protein